MKYNLIYSLMLALVPVIVACERDIADGSQSENLNNVDGLEMSKNIGFEYINTLDLMRCLQTNRSSLQKDSFLIATEAELLNVVDPVCNDVLPSVSFGDSLVVGYAERIGGQWKASDRQLKYDTVSRILIYSVTSYTSDTASLTLDFNWIKFPIMPIDSVIFDIKSIRS